MFIIGIIVIIFRVFALDLWLIMISIIAMVMMKHLCQGNAVLSASSSVS